jgi:spermidine synthase
MGVVGLGAGSLADWLRAEDRGVFYELNPQVEDIARQWFFALPEAKAPIEVVIGDARRRLSEESARGYDLLVIDAFNSDAVPTHLLTRECFELYRRHLAPGAILAVHISNRFVSLEPVLAAEAKAGGWAGRVIFDHVDDVDVMHFASKWVLMASTAETLAALADGAPLGEDALPAPWTDDYAPLWGLFEWR